MRDMVWDHVIVAVSGEFIWCAGHGCISARRLFNLGGSPWESFGRHYHYDPSVNTDLRQLMRPQLQRDRGMFGISVSGMKLEREPELISSLEHRDRWMGTRVYKTPKFASNYLFGAPTTRTVTADDGETVYIPCNFSSALTGWAKLLNSCCNGRLRTLKWIRKEIESDTPRWRDHEKKGMSSVPGVLIAQFNTRLEL